MIFVTVGTQDKPFTRLIKAIDEAVKDKKITDHVIVQAGHTKYMSDNLEILNYIPYEQFEDYIKKADIIITHGGVGSILNAIKQNKKVIAVPRLAKYGEHINDHQLQVIKKMVLNGYILSCEDENDIHIKINEAKVFIPKEFTPNTSNFIKGFEKVLEDVLK